ncbi:Retrotransposon gag protein [Ceratobasidium sp. AG-Ba]|nr:Retrotransposon gag protein [Ceratobasidium sp. AG-Ba]QRW06295.1 Retrotransposon gag protein [Ceratobasidium sp. AG-Ba]
MSEIGDPPDVVPPPGFLEKGGDTVGAVNQLHECYTALVNELNAHANSTTARLSTLETRSLAAEASLATITANLSTLLSRFPTQIVNAQSSLSSSPVAAIPRPIKGAKLAQFSSKAQDVERFLTDLRNDIELQGPLTFTTGYQKSIYMATFLRDTQSASDWISGIRNTTPDLLNHFDSVTEAFAKHFGSANKVEDALQKLKVLKQSGLAATYAACFRELSAALPQEQFFLKTMFLTGSRMKSAPGFMVCLTAKKSATALKATPWTAPKAKSSTPSSSTPAPSPSAPASSSLSGPVPMELGAACVAGPLDPSEKERSKMLGLCVYCGGQHTTNNCQLLKEKNACKANRKGKANPQA